MPPIDDGYDNFKGTVPAFGTRREINFQYRPAGDAAIRNWKWRCSASAAEEGSATLDLLATSLRGWDLTAKDGSPLPIDRKTIDANLRHREREIIVTFVTGYSANEQRADEKNSDTASVSLPCTPTSST